MCAEKLIEKYIDAAIKYGLAQEDGNSKRVNQSAAIIRKIRKELKENNVSYELYFEELLQHDNDYVKLKVSYDLLPILTEKAVETLVELSKKRGLIAFEAEMVLAEWKKGNLLF